MGPKARGSAAWVAVLVVGASCLPPTQADEAIAFEPPMPAPAPLIQGPAPATADETAVVLVVLDGVRWQDVFVAANTPHLHAMMASRGAAIGAPGMGPVMSASGPAFVSLPGYSEIFTGRRAHGCADNDCAPARAPTIFDEATGLGQRPGDVAVFASWERIDRAASSLPGSFVLSAGRSSVWRGEELREDAATAEWLDRGAHADPAPGYGDFRPDRLTAGLALRYLETRHPRLAFLGLGESDEYGHRGDYSGYLASLRAADATIGELFDVLDRMGNRGARTTVIISADHGRARDWRHHGREFPESARTWLVAAGWGVSARGLLRSTRRHRLSDIAPTMRELLELPADAASTSGMPLDELFTPAAPVVATESP